MHWSDALQQLVYAAGGCVVSCAPQPGAAQSLLRGHTAPISAVAVSRSGRAVASAQCGSEPDIVVWTVGEGDGPQAAEVVWRLPEHDAPVDLLAWSPDERLLLSASDAPSPRWVVWDTATGCMVAAGTPAQQAWTAAAFGQWLRDAKGRPTGLYTWASASPGGTLQLWTLNPLTGRAVSDTVIAHGTGRDVQCLEWSADGRWLYAGTSSGELLAVDSRTKKWSASACLAAGGITSLATIPTGVILGAGDGTVLRLRGHGADVVTVAQCKVAAAVRGLAVMGCTGPAAHSPATPISSGRRAGLAAAVVVPAGGEVHACIGSLDGTIVTVTLPDQTVPGTPAPAPSKPLMQAHAPSAATYGEGVGDKARHGITAVAAGTAAPARTAALSTGVLGVAYAHGISEAFVTAGADNTLRVYDAGEYAVHALATARGAGHPTAVQFGGEWMLSGWQDGHLRAHAALTSGAGAEPGALLWDIPGAHARGVSSLGLAKNQRFAVSGGVDGTVRVWELRGRELLSTLSQHSGVVSAVALYSDDVHALTASSDRSMVCWDLRAERRVSAHAVPAGGIAALAISPDQSIVITGGADRALSWWDLREAQPLRVTAAAHGGAEITALAVSSGCPYVVSGGSDGAVALWDVRSGRSVAREQGPTGGVAQLAVAPDGRQVVSAGADGTVCVWNVL